MTSNNINNRELEVPYLFNCCIYNNTSICYIITIKCISLSVKNLYRVQKDLHYIKNKQLKHYTSHENHVILRTLINCSKLNGAHTKLIIEIEEPNSITKLNNLVNLPVHHAFVTGT